MVAIHWSKNGYLLQLPRDIVLSIDIEPNGRGERGGKYWDGTHAAFRELTQWRAELELQTGSPVRFNWFLRCDPQIAKVSGDAGYIETACPELIRFLKAGGDFCGIHTHFQRWDASRNRWFSEFSDLAWSAHCLALNIQTFERILGYRPLASRFGDRFCSNALLSLLRAEGIRYDLTVEPGVPDQWLFHDRHATCWLPDFRRAPRAPYQPSPADYLTPEANPTASMLWVLPLTTTSPTRWIPVRRFPFVMKASRPLNLVLRPRTLWRYLESELASQRAAPLVLVMRTGDLASPRYLKNFRYLARRIASHPGLHNARFTRVDDAVERFAQAR